MYFIFNRKQSFCPLKMKSVVIFVCFVLYQIQFSFSSTIKSEHNKQSQWLPKCCPEDKVISSDGKSCVHDPSLSVLNNATIDNNVDVLNVSVNDRSVQYRLVHKTKFNCRRSELYVVHNIYVTPDNDVVVYDEFGDEWTLSITEMCVDSVMLSPSPGLHPSRTFVALLCPSCQGLVCLYKCCAETDRLQVNEDGTKVDCVPYSGPSWSQQSLDKTSKRIFVFHGFPECSHSLSLENPSGYLEVEPFGSLLLRQDVQFPRDEYCVDYTDGPGDSVLLACRQPLPFTTSFKPTLYSALLCVSVVFLALTLGLHLWLPELRASLHSRVLLSHISCLLAAFLGLATADLAPLPAPSLACSSTAFLIQFSILAAMFWLNVMCVDIAWTFSGVRAPRGSSTKNSDRHKYFYYSIYAWGSTITICALTTFIEHSSMSPFSSRIRPGFGINSCWLRNWVSILLVYGPMGVLFLTNIGLFVYTAAKIRTTYRDTAAILQHAGFKHREDKERFSLYIKLFCLMGLHWMLEVVSWFDKGPQSTWNIMDIFNAFRGVCIFMLFCAKKKVIVLIKAKLGI